MKEEIELIRISQTLIEDLAKILEENKGNRVRIITREDFDKSITYGTLHKIYELDNGFVLFLKDDKELTSLVFNPFISEITFNPLG
ncbi:MAG: hypothetical protein ACXAC8_17615 [Candidatus Hodarchaeales archaeon]